MGEWPTDQDNAPEWLKVLNDDFEKRQIKHEVFESDWEVHSIGVMNDTLKFNFNEIADVLELVYVHGMLEGDYES